MRVSEDGFVTGEMFGEYIDWRAEHPSDDIMTDLLNAEFEDETGTRRRLARQEVLTYVQVVAGAGNETTTRLIGWTAKLLAEHPDQRARARRGPRADPERHRGDAPLRAARAPRRVGTWPPTSSSTATSCRRAAPSSSSSVRRTATKPKFDDPDRFDIHRVDQLAPHVRVRPALLSGRGPRPAGGPRRARRDARRGSRSGTSTWTTPSWRPPRRCAAGNVSRSCSAERRSEGPDWRCAPGSSFRTACTVTLMSDSTAEKLFIVDADSHWSEPADLFTSRAPAEYRDRVPRVEEVDGERSWVFDGHVVGRHSAAGVIGRDGKKEQAEKALFEWDHDMVHVGAYDPKVRLAVLDEVGIDAQIIFPSTIGLGGQDLGMVEDEALKRRQRRDLQRRHGRDPGRLRQPAAAPAADAGLERRRLRRRGEAGRRARRPRREHDVRPRRPRRARPRQPGVGSALGDLHRAAAPRALPHRGQRHRHDLLRALPVGRRTARTRSWPSAERCCSSATPGSSRT